MATDFLLISLELHASLQQLELVGQSLVTLQPFGTSFRCWSWLLLPQFPAIWTLKSSAQFLTLLLLSPPGTFLALQCVATYVERWSMKFLEEFFPSTADRDSKSGIRLSNPGDGTATILNTHLQAAYDRATSEIQSYWRKGKELMMDIKEFIGYLLANINLGLTSVPTSSEFWQDEATSSDSGSTSLGPGSLAAGAGDEAVYSGLDFETGPIRLTTPLPFIPRPLENEVGDEVRPPLDPGVETEQTVVQEALPPTSSASSVRDSLQRDRKRSNSTWSPSITSKADMTLEHYHTSPLATHAVDTLRYHIQWVIWDLLLIPLESLYARSLAQSFSSTHFPPFGSPSLSVYPLGSWCGAGSWLQRSQYVRSILLCTGAEVAVSYGVWQVTTGMAWWIGKRWFKWGRF